MFVSKILLYFFLFHSSNLLSHDGTFFIDEANRKLVLHGVTHIFVAINPDSNEFSHNYFNDSDIDTLKSNGFNAVKIGVIWDLIETMPNRFSTKYIDEVIKIAKKLTENGIYVMFGIYQERYNQRFCGFGVPHFHLKEINSKDLCISSLHSYFSSLVTQCKTIEALNLKYNNSLPTRESCLQQKQTNLNNLPELEEATDSLQKNKNGLLDKLIEMWRFVIRRLIENDIDNHLLGVEIWNLPMANPKIVSDYLPGKLTNDYLYKFHRHIFNELNEELSSLLFTFTGSSYDTRPLYGWNIFGGFKKLPGGYDFRHRQALSVQYNCSELLKKEVNLFDVFYDCKHLLKERIEFDRRNAEKLEVPMVIGSFGNCGNDAACFEEIEQLTELAERNLVSWFYQFYKTFPSYIYKESVGFVDEKGKINEKKKRILGKVYTQSYQGTPEFSYFDTFNKLYETIYLLDTNIKKPTVVHLGTANKNNIKVAVTLDDGPCQFEHYFTEYGVNVIMRDLIGKVRIVITNIEE